MTLHSHDDPLQGEKLTRFVEHRLKAESEGLSRKHYDPKKARRCEECGTFLVFDPYRNRQTEERKRVLAGANFCEVRWCVMCAWRKSLKLVQELRSICDQAEALQPVRYLFLTLTIENPPLTELRDSIKHMGKAFHKLTGTPEFRDVLGYFRAIEYLGGKTKQGEAHPHFHTLLVVKPEYFIKGNYVTQARWCEVWQRCLKVDYTPIVDVRKVKPKCEGLSARDSAIFEVAKYQVKPQEIKKLTKKDFKILDLQTKGTRQYARGGLLKVLKPKEREELDPAIWEKLEREFYRWIGGKYEKTE